MSKDMRIHRAPNLRIVLVGLIAALTANTIPMTKIQAVEVAAPASATEAEQAVVTVVLQKTKAEDMAKRLLSLQNIDGEAKTTLAANVTTNSLTITTEKKFVDGLRELVGLLDEASEQIVTEVYFLDHAGGLDAKTLDFAKIKDLRGVQIKAHPIIVTTNGQETTRYVGEDFNLPVDSTPSLPVGSWTMTVRPENAADGIHYSFTATLVASGTPPERPVFSRTKESKSAGVVAPGETIILPIGWPDLVMVMKFTIFNAHPASAASATSSTIASDLPPLASATGPSATAVPTSLPSELLQPRHALLEHIWVLEIPNNLKLDPATLLENDPQFPLVIKLKETAGISVKSSATALIEEGNAFEFRTSYPFGESPINGSVNLPAQSTGPHGHGPPDPSTMYLSARAETVLGDTLHFSIFDYVPPSEKAPEGAACWTSDLTKGGQPVLFPLTSAGKDSKYVAVITFTLVDPHFWTEDLSDSSASPWSNAHADLEAFFYPLAHVQAYPIAKFLNAVPDNLQGDNHHTTLRVDSSTHALIVITEKDNVARLRAILAALDRPGPAQSQRESASAPPQ